MNKRSYKAFEKNEELKIKQNLLKILTVIKENRRVRNLKNKLFKLHQTDIWGSLANGHHDKLVTQLIADANKAKLITELRKYPINISTKIKQEVLWGNKRATKKIFLYQLTQAPKKIKPIKKSLRATVLKDRRKLTMFYFAGKIREKTLRKFSKLHLERSYVSPHNRIGKNRFLAYASYKTFTLFLEARIDVLVLRVELLPTMFSIRQALYHRKGKVKGQTPLNHPGFLVKMHRAFNVDQQYLKELKKNTDKNKEKDGVLKKYKKKLPIYLMRTNSIIKRIRKVFEPLYNLIRFPFTSLGPKVLKFSRLK